MTPEQAEKFLKHAERQTGFLVMIIKKLDEMTRNNAPLSPNYRRHLSEFDGFDWASIGAKPIAKDQRGAISEVEWNGHRFDRSTGEKFGGGFIIFSRPAPDWTQTNKTYYTLIRFADYNDDALIIEDEPPAAPPPPRAAAAPPRLIKSSQATPPAPIVASQPAPPATEGRDNPHLAQAAAVASAADFYALATQLTRQRKGNLHAIVSRVVNTPETSWTEKALELIAA